MPPPPELLPSHFSRTVSPSSPPPAASGLPRPETRPARGRLWMERLELLLRVVLRIYVGIVLAVLPWTRVWESNRLFLDLPSLGVFACSGSVRGVITGLGLLNLWIALADASERRRP